MKKQLITHDEAQTVERQPTKPCSDCPWARGALPGWLGALSVEEWLKVAHGDHPVDCHALKSCSGKPHNCAGLAIYRSNMAKSARCDPFRLPADRQHVFASPVEFREHHNKTQGK